MGHDVPKGNRSQSALDVPGSRVAAVTAAGENTVTTGIRRAKQRTRVCYAATRSSPLLVERRSSFKSM